MEIKLLFTYFRCGKGRKGADLEISKCIPVRGKLKATGYSMTPPFLNRTPKPTCE